MSTDHPTDTKTVSPPSPSADAAAGKAERLKAYRKAYWQTFKRDHVRVYGTLTKAEHAEIKRVAERSGRSVWEQIWRESLAYRRGDYLPPPTSPRGSRDCTASSALSATTSIRSPGGPTPRARSGSRARR